MDFSRNPYITHIEKMSAVQRRLIVHSILYYEMDMPVLSDTEYDELARQLVELYEQTTQEQRVKSRYWYCMHDFDSSTGFDIPARLLSVDRAHLSMIANSVARAYENDRKWKEKM